MGDQRSISVFTKSPEVMYFHLKATCAVQPAVLGDDWRKAAGAFNSLPRELRHNMPAEIARATKKKSRRKAALRPKGQ